MVTFLFTDIENSTEKWNKYGKKMNKVLAHHDRIITELIKKFGGKPVKQTGDGIFAIFEKGNPLKCAIEIEKSIMNEDWSEIKDLRVRVVLHSGEAELRGNDYFGYDVNFTARMLNIGWGGQILLSERIVKTGKIPKDAEILYLGSCMLRGVQNPQKIYQLIHPSLKLKKFPPLRSKGIYPNNLPQQSTEFIGRNKELDELRRLISSSQIKLITLLGPGGIGKTRLALKTAEQNMKFFPDGVYFIPLASIDNHELIILSLANILNITFYPGDEPLNQIIKFLKNRTMLLIMDNFEHVIEGATFIIDILRKCPGIKFIVTSRVRLNIKDEQVFKVFGMKLKKGAEALQLFISAARRIEPEFEINENNKSVVFNICRRVEGIPLGIELAVSWLKTLTVEEIDEELSKSFEILETDIKDFPKRHKSFRGVFKYSWDLLNDKEKDVLSKISIFAANFNKESARYVAGASLSILTSLIDKSLIQRVEKRVYTLHELLREFAREKLSENPKKEEETVKRYIDYYIEFLKVYKNFMNFNLYKSFFLEMSIEIENVRKAWYYILKKGLLEKLEEFINPVYQFHRLKGLLKEGEKLLKDAIAKIKNEGLNNSNLLVKLYNKVASLLFRRGLYKEAKTYFEKAIETKKFNTDLYEEISSLTGLANVLHSTGDYKKAEDILNKALKIAETNKNKYGIAQCLNSMGVVKRKKGYLKEALRLYEKALEITKGENLDVLRVFLMINIGNIHSLLGNLSRAKGYYEEIKPELENIGLKRELALLLNNLGRVYFAENAIDKCEKLFLESLEIAKEIGDLWTQGLVLGNLGEVYKKKKDIDRARKTFIDSLEINRKIGNKKRIADELQSLAYLLEMEGELEEALNTFRKALKIRKELGDKRGLAVVLSAIGLIKNTQGKYDEASGYIEEALGLFHEIGIKANELTNLLTLAEIYAQLKNVDKINYYLEQTQKLFKYIESDQDSARLLIVGIKKLILQKKLDKALKILLFLKENFENTGSFDEEIKQNVLELEEILYHKYSSEYINSIKKDITDLTMNNITGMMLGK